MKTLKKIAMFALLIIMVGCGYDKVTGTTYANVTLGEEIPTVRLRFENEDTAASIYTFIVIVNGLSTGGVSDCKIIISDDGKKFECSLSEIKKASEFEDMGLPEEWTDFISEKHIGNGTVLIQDFVQKEAMVEIAEYTQEQVISPIVEKYGGESDAESIIKNEETSTNETSTESADETEVLDELEYKYDEDNYIVVDIAKDYSTGRIMLIANGTYAEGFEELVLYDCLWAAVYPAAGNDVDVVYIASIGEETYGFIYNDGELLSNRMPDDSEDLPDEYNSKCIEFMLKISDLYEKYGIVEKTESTSTPTPTPTQKETILYEDEKVIISFSGITEKGVEFWVQNLTDVNITIQADSISINGISTDEIIMSSDVAPQSKGKVTAWCDDFQPAEQVNTVGGQLRVIDFDKSFDTYEVLFVNVPIE